jgi:acetoin utilization protein AcuB
MRNDQSVTPYFTIGSHAVEAHQSIALAIDVMQKHDLRHLPVIEEGKVVGEISERDLRVWSLKPDLGEEITVRHIMVEDPFTITPGAPLEVVATEMANRKIGCAIVVDSDRLVGMFTVTDALRALARLSSDSA